MLKLEERSVCRDKGRPVPLTPGSASVTVCLVPKWWNPPVGAGHRTPGLLGGGGHYMDSKTDSEARAPRAGWLAALHAACFLWPQCLIRQTASFSSHQMPSYICSHYPCSYLPGPDDLFQSSCWKVPDGLPSGNLRFSYHTPPELEEIRVS